MKSFILATAIIVAPMAVNAGEEVVVPEVDESSTVDKQKFSYKWRYKGDPTDYSQMVILTLYSFDPYDNEARKVGWACISLFVNFEKRVPMGEEDIKTTDVGYFNLKIEIFTSRRTIYASNSG